MRSVTKCQYLLMVLAYFITGCAYVGVGATPQKNEQQVIFTSGRGDKYNIFLANVNDNTTRQLLIDEAGYVGLQPSPNGEEVLLTMIHDYVLYKLIVDTGEIVTLSTNADILTYKWSPNGELIAFTSRSPYENDGALFVINKAGSGEKQLTFQSGNVSNIDWSADGKSIVYSYVEDGKVSLYVIPVEGGTPTLLTATSVADSDPDWSPVRNEVLYTCKIKGQDHLCITNIDTDTSSVITRGRGGRWSPDGETIVLSLANGDGTGLSTIKRDGTNQSTWSERGFNAVWSKNGTLVAYYTSGDIYVINLTTGEIKMIAENGGPPQWIDP